MDEAGLEEELPESFLRKKAAKIGIEGMSEDPPPYSQN
jgi:hypothetical protein